MGKKSKRKKSRSKCQTTPPSASSRKKTKSSDVTTTTTQVKVEPDKDASKALISTARTRPQRPTPKPRPLLLAYKPEADDVIVNLFSTVTDEVCFCKSVRQQEDIVVGPCGHIMCTNCFLQGCPLCKAEKGIVYPSTSAAEKQRSTTLKVDQYSVQTEVTLGAFEVGSSGAKYEVNLRFLVPFDCNPEPEVQAN